MADKKRKTLQIKRPSATKPSVRKKTSDLSKNDETDTEKTANEGKVIAQSKKGATTRISLPDGDKIAKARGAGGSSDKKEDKLPSAEQLNKIGNNQTMAIEIDDDDVSTSTQKLPNVEVPSDNDQTMQINIDELESSDDEKKLSEANQDNSTANNDQTMQINADELLAADDKSKLEESSGDDNDRTMRLQTQDLTHAQNRAEDAEKKTSAGNNDQTLQVDKEEIEKTLSEESSGDDNDRTMRLQTQDLTHAQNRAKDAEKKTSAGNNDQTLQVDKEEIEKTLSEKNEVADVQNLETMSLDEKELDSEISRQEMEESFNAQTMAMDSDQLANELEESSSEDANSETDLTREEMEESFKAQTMAMDPEQLAKELEKTSDKKESDSNKTMDLSKKKAPKTVMVKRPSRQGTASNAPTVKASRPAVANQSTAKSSTSRIEIPSDEGSSKEGKTIKLKRPSGNKKSSITSGSGIELDEDSTISAVAKEKKMGGPWVAVAIVSFLVSLGAIWAIMAIDQPELPMPGRLIDVNGQLMR